MISHSARLTGPFPGSTSPRFGDHFIVRSSAFWRESQPTKRWSVTVLIHYAPFCNQIFSVREHASGTVLRAAAGHLEAVLDPGGARAVMVRPVCSGPCAP